MAKYLALYNPYSGNGKGKELASKLTSILTDSEIEYIDITSIADYSEFFKNLPADSDVVICGGDGTLNRFINDSKDAVYPEKLYYCPCGTGNDFSRDINAPADAITDIKKYLTDLPTVTVNGKKSLFLNNVGFGIDGYCTAEGDKMREAHVEDINYTAIAIKGLLGKFKPVNATVTVDGNTTTYKKAWLAPTMKGRYYGGGMIPTPSQDRLDEDKSVSVMLFHGKGKLKTLMVFPSIFKGEHIKHENMVTVIKGNSVKVTFDKPTPLQIDGETVLGVTEYEVTT